MTIKDWCKIGGTVVAVGSTIAGIVYGVCEFVIEARANPGNIADFKREFNEFKKDMEEEHKEFRKGIAENKQDSQVNRAILLEVREGVRTIQQALVNKGVK